MTHDDARLHASARADGEAHDAAALDAHLAGCAECAAYARGLARLSTLAAALPREPAPRDLVATVTRHVRRRRLARGVRLGAGLAAATAAAVVLTTLPVTTGTFPAPPAAAAEPLRALRSIYVERTVTSPEGEATERIWFRAPASVRIERVVDGGPVEVTIDTPGTTYEGGVVTRHAAPGIPLPEPISPTVSLLGRDAGPGPTIAGRATRRVELTVGSERRTAYVDVERALALGADEVLVLTKLGGQVTKRVTRVDRDAAVPDSLFAPPAGASEVDGGFRVRGLGSLGIAPRRLPEGYLPVLVGSDPAGESALFADGSLPLLVTTRPVDTDRPTDVRTVARGDRTYVVTVSLYAPPSVAFFRDGDAVTLVSPLPVDSLLAMAEAMYPE